MPWKYSDAYYQEYTRTTWNESSGAYGRLLKNLAPFRADLVRELRPRTGETVLDLGTGPGEPALTIAELVGPAGHVTGVDLAERMVTIAQQAAEARGITNATFRSMDCSALDFRDESFDAVSCAFGFQIFTNPEKAAREAFRVLTSGGRIGVTVWGRGPQVPALDVIIAPMLEHAEPDETGYLPTPYETGGPGEMARFLRDAGFRDAVERRVNHPWSFIDEDDYLESILTATPIGHSLSEETEEVQQEVLRKTRENLQRWKAEDGLRIPAEAAIVIARR